MKEINMYAIFVNYCARPDKKENNSHTQKKTELRAFFKKKKNST